MGSIIGLEDYEERLLKLAAKYYIRYKSHTGTEKDRRRFCKILDLLYKHDILRKPLQKEEKIEEEKEGKLVYLNTGPTLTKIDLQIDDSEKITR